MPNDPNWYAPPAADAPPPEAPPDALDANPEYVGFGVRAGARIADVIAIFIFALMGGAAGGAFAAILAASGLLSSGWMHRLQGAAASTYAFGLLASLCYHMVAEGLGGATIGKAVFGIRVLREDLHPAGLGPALVRNLAYYVDAFFCGLVAYSVMGGSPRHQRLGDKWGHTVVVRSASLPAGLRGGTGVGLVLGIVGHLVVDVVSVVVRAL